MRLEAIALEGGLPEPEDPGPLPLGNNPPKALLDQGSYGRPLPGG